MLTFGSFSKGLQGLAGLETNRMRNELSMCLESRLEVATCIKTMHVCQVLQNILALIAVA